MIYGLPSWYLRSYRILVIAVLGLLLLGGSVRVMNAGLACPDWPLCYGNWIPDFHPQVYFEFIHRVMAGVIALVTLGLQILLFSRKQVPAKLKFLAAFSLLMLVGQIVLGGLTVLWQLKSGVVASHLGMEQRCLPCSCGFLSSSSERSNPRHRRGYQGLSKAGQL